MGSDWDKEKRKERIAIWEEGGHTQQIRKLVECSLRLLHHCEIRCTYSYVLAIYVLRNICTYIPYVLSHMQEGMSAGMLLGDGCLSCYYRTVVQDFQIRFRLRSSCCILYTF